MKLHAYVGFVHQIVSLRISRGYMAFLLPSTAKNLCAEKFRRFRELFELSVYLPGLNPSALAVITIYLTSPVWL